MDRSQVRKGVMFIGPGKRSQGGISAVISNYAKTSFWLDGRCTRFSSTEDYEHKPIALLADAFRICLFATTVWYPSRPCAVSIHTSHTGSFYRKLPYILISRLFRIPVVLHIHPAAFADFFRYGNRILRATIELAGKVSDQIVCLTPDTRNALVEVFDQTKLRILGNPVDVKHFARADHTGRATRPRILFLGWIVETKGVYDLVEAIPVVLKHIPNAIFSFAGNKEVEKLRNVIAEKGLSESAEVLGWVDGHRKLDLIHSSSVLILPSYTEGLSPATSIPSPKVSWPYCKIIENIQISLRRHTNTYAGTIALRR